MTTSNANRHWLYGNSHGVLEIDGRAATAQEFINAGGNLLSRICHGHYWSWCGYGHPRKEIAHVD